MSEQPSGPTSQSYISQRLRLHYVDWGNPTAPPLLLIHGGQDHCRNWDWVAQELRGDYHIIAPDLRGHGDSAWSPSASTRMSAYVYDVAQLIHQQNLAPGQDHRPLDGRQRRAALRRRLSGNGHQAGVDRGAGPLARHDAAPRGDERAQSACAAGSSRSAASPAACPRRYATIEDAFHRMQDREQAPYARAGPLPHRARRGAERGRHLQLEVRQLRAARTRRPTLRPRTCTSCGRTSPARCCS